MQRRNHFLKIINKLTKKAVDVGLKKVQKDAAKKVGEEKAKELVGNLKQKMEEDKPFQQKLKEVNAVGKTALITSAILGAGAAAGIGAGAGGAGAAGAGGAGAASAGAGAGSAAGVGTAAGLGTAGLSAAQILSKSGEVAGDQDKTVLEQVLDSRLAEQTGNALLNRIVEGKEDTGIPSSAPTAFRKIDDTPLEKKEGIFPVDDNTMIIVIVGIVVLLLMTKRK